MPSAKSDRKLDLVLFGATGFVGRLTAEDLAKNAPSATQIGLAGRSAERLERVRASLGGNAADWPVIEVDALDPSSVAALARRTKVVATTVGPYEQYGFPLAVACADAGTHYADLTGEVPFMHRTATELHEVAAASGARIVHACGFDSIPSDLGVLSLYEAARADGAEGLEETTYVVTALRGGISGGTLASAKNLFANMRTSPDLRRLVFDPYSLSPDREHEPDRRQPGWPKEPDVRGVHRDADLDMWLAPFAMATSNTRVVRRSNALQQWAYGPRLRYREVMGFAGTAGVAKASAATAGLASFAGAMSFGPTRALLDRVLPSPGEGPSEKTRTNGFFRIEIYAKTSDGRRYRARVGAKGDPGYAATAVMLGESALALASDGAKLPARAGVLTPATGIGARLIERLRDRDFTFAVDRL